MGPNWAAPNSPRMTSTENSAPAMGALKVAAMPAAAPQPTSVRRRRLDMPIAWPTRDARAAAIWTMGPSRPADPPLPMVTADAMVLAMATRPRILPPSSATAFITSGMPWPLASETRKVVMRPTRSPPNAGTRAIFQAGTSRRNPMPGSTAPQKPSWKRWMAVSKAMAPRPPRRPMKAAVNSRKTYSPPRARSTQERPTRRAQRARARRRGRMDVSFSVSLIMERLTIRYSTFDVQHPTAPKENGLDSGRGRRIHCAK